MASIVETKAVALRRGNHNENLAFTGVQGEVVVDLGNPDAGELGTDANATLRLHNGITRGGIPMARADMLNVSTDLLTKDRHAVGEKNLACADLSNIEEATNPTEREKIKETLVDYGLADKSQVDTQLETKVNVSTNNLNTAQLVSSAIHNGVDGNKPLAYADTSNINTADLVDFTKHTGTSGNKPLGYADTSNVNTSDLVSSTIHDGTSGNKPLSYNDLANVDTTNLTLDQSNRPSEMSGPVLAASDLSNVSDTTFQQILNKPALNIEKITNKDSSIDINQLQPGRYPETQAVVSYLEQTLNNTNIFANNTLTNVSDWDVIFYNPETPIVSYSANVISSSQSFSKGDNFVTDILLTNDPTGYLTIQIDSVDENGSILSMSLKQNCGCKNFASSEVLTITSETNGNATFTLTSTYVSDNVYSYQLNTITNSGTGFVANNDYMAKNSSDKPLNIAYRNLIVVISDVSSDGTIRNVRFEPKNGLTPVTDVINISSGDLSAQLNVTSEIYNEGGGAGALKNDLSNLQGMSNEDKEYASNSPWRIRHNEAFPSTTGSTIPESQDYTIATNGAVWRELKQEYYTKAEIDTLIQQIYAAINGGS